MMIHFLNGSIYQLVGADKPESLVGTNPVGIGISEYAIQDPAAWEFLKPILAENGGWMAAVYTPRGKNHGYKLFKMAGRQKNWLCDKRVAGDNGTRRHNGKPVVSDDYLDKERREGANDSLISPFLSCTRTEEEHGN